MKSIGLTLQQAREARDMSIEDVARLTRIPRATIIAIENDDRAALPADVYVRGFTRTIATSVGLNHQDVLRTKPVEHSQDTAPQQQDDRFAILLGVRSTDHPSLGLAPIVMAFVAVSFFLAAWLLVGNSPSERATAQDLDGAVPAIQEHVDAVTPFTAQDLRADARR